MKRRIPNPSAGHDNCATVLMSVAIEAVPVTDSQRDGIMTQVRVDFPTPLIDASTVLALLARTPQLDRSDTVMARLFAALRDLLLEEQPAAGARLQ